MKSQEGQIISRFRSTRFDDGYYNPHTDGWILDRSFSTRSERNTFEKRGDRIVCNDRLGRSKLPIWKGIIKFVFKLTVYIIWKVFSIIFYVEDCLGAYAFLLLAAVIPYIIYSIKTDGNPLEEAFIYIRSRIRQSPSED